MQVKVLTQDGGGGGGGRTRRRADARLIMDVRGSRAACGGCCKSLVSPGVSPDRPASCVAVPCHVVGFASGCGQFSRIVS